MCIENFVASQFRIEEHILTYLHIRVFLTLDENAVRGDS